MIGRNTVATATSGVDEHRAVGNRERQVLRHHLAEHDVQERHDDQGDRERDATDHLLGERRQRQRDLEQVVDRRLGHVEDEQRAHGDAELARREHERRVLHRPERGLRRPGSGFGARLDLRAPRGDDRELGADEERVDEQQHAEPGDTPPVDAGDAAFGEERERGHFFSPEFLSAER
jgi:hypothetical protein